MTIITPVNVINETSNGPRLTEKMQDYIAKAKPGSKIFFENIKARMTKTTVSMPSRSLSPMSFTIQ